MRILKFIPVLLLSLIFVSCAEKEEAHETHAGEKDACEAACEAEAAGARAEEGGHEAHSGEEGHVEVTEAMAHQMGLAVETARMARITRQLELPGEVVPDPERVLHAAARFSGVALSVRKGVGDAVAPGDTLAVIESNENLSPFSILAQRAGMVIDKHLVPGEFVDAARDLFVIADLSQVAVNIAFFGRDADVIRTGVAAQVTDLSGDHRVTATVRYVSPVHNESTRSLTARIMLANSNGIWKPGAIVRVSIGVEEGGSVLSVPNDAIQLLEGTSHVFRPADEKGAYRAVPVRTGRVGSSLTEILEGLSLGDSLVVRGAFELKAHLAVQSLEGGCSH